MTGRERLAAAFSSAGTSEIGVVICYEGIYIRDRWDDLVSRPWWFRHAPDVARQLAWRREAIARLGQDWLAVEAVASRQEREDLELQAGAKGVYLVHRATGRRQPLSREDVGGWSRLRRARAISRRQRIRSSVEEILDSMPSPPPFDPHEFASSGRADLARALLQGPGRDLFAACHVSAPLWALYNVLGFEEMMVLVASRPDLVEAACERLLAAAVRRVKAAAALGAHGIWIEDCLTDMVSPEAFARLNVPFVRTLTEEMGAQGLYAIHYFCGDPKGKWDLLFDTGADALALEESKKGFRIDIEDVVARVDGRMAVFGNLDSIAVLEGGSVAQLRAEIARQIAAGRRNGSRFVLSTGSPVTPRTPPERVRLYTDLGHELGCR